MLLIRTRLRFFMFYDLPSLCLIQIKTLLGQIFVAKLICDSVEDRSRTETGQKDCVGDKSPRVETTPLTTLVVLSYIYFNPSICCLNIIFRTISCINIILCVRGCALLLQAIPNESSEQSEIQQETQLTLQRCRDTTQSNIFSRAHSQQL